MACMDELWTFKRENFGLCMGDYAKGRFDVKEALTEDGLKVLKMFGRMIEKLKYIKN